MPIRSICVALTSLAILKSMNLNGAMCLVGSRVIQCWRSSAMVLLVYFHRLLPSDTWLMRRNSSPAAEVVLGAVATPVAASAAAVNPMSLDLVIPPVSRSTEVERRPRTVA